jgi:hypothetical protein
MDIDYKEKYLKYKNKYLELKKLTGNNTRINSKCERENRCINLISKLDEIKKALQTNCNRMEFLEKVPSKEAQLDNEYYDILSRIEKYAKSIQQNLDIKIPEPTCK